MASGPHALLLARDGNEIRDARARRRCERVARRATLAIWVIERDRLRALERSIGDLGRQVILIFRMARHASGMAFHHRGWQKGRLAEAKDRHDEAVSPA